MGSLKEEAKNYVPKQTKNIADLPEVDINLNLLNGEGIDDKGNTFKYKYIELNGEEYRVPNKVIGDIKSILEKKPNLKKISVIKKGTGMSTQYTVVSIE